MDVFLSDQEPEKIAGQSELFIYPLHKFSVISGLFTNFHYPKTSVLTLTAAMVERIDRQDLQRSFRKRISLVFLW